MYPHHPNFDPFYIFAKKKYCDRLDKATAQVITRTRF